LNLHGRDSLTFAESELTFQSWCPKRSDTHNFKFVRKRMQLAGRCLPVITAVGTSN